MQVAAGVVALMAVLQVAYSFDAGPNAVIFTLDHTVPEFLAAVKHSFPPEANGDRCEAVAAGEWWQAVPVF